MTRARDLADFASDSQINAGEIEDNAVTTAKIADSNVTNAKLTNSTITVSGDSGSDSVALGETLTIAGTSNEIITTGTSNTLTVGLPDDVTIGNDLTVTAHISTSTAKTDRLRINTTTQLGRLTINGDDSYNNGPVAWLHGNSVNQSNSGTIRLTEDNASMQGAWIRYNGAGNRLLLGTHAASDFTTSNDITHISMSRGSGFVGINIGDANPAYPLVVGNNEGVQDASIEIKGLFPFLKYTDTGDSTYATQQLNGGNFTHNQSGNNQFRIVQDTSAQFYYNVIVDGDLTVDTSTLHVDSTNNRVGIGTTSPAADLDIVSSGTDGRGLQVRAGDAAGSTDSSQIIFSYNGNSYDSGGYGHSIRTRHNSTSAGGNAIDFWLWDQSTDTSSTLGSLRVMTIEGEDDGKVGIGTAAPSYNLHVVGDAYVSTNLTVDGNLTINGTTTTVSSTNTQITDNLLELNSGATANTNDSGIIIERGSTGDNAIMAWDESTDQFIFGTTTATASDTGNLTISTANMTVNNIDLTGSVYVPDGKRVIWGNGNQASIEYFGGLYLRNSTNIVVELTGSTNKTFQIQKFGGEKIFKVVGDGANELYYDGSLKLATTSSGINVTGTVVSDGLTVDGNAQINGDITVFDGTTDPFIKLQTNEHQTVLRIDNDASDIFQIRDVTNSANRLGISTGGDISFYEDTGTTAKFFWDASAERLGIGETSPSAPLHIKVPSSGSALTDAVQIRDSSNYVDIAMYVGAADGEIRVGAAGQLRGRYAAQYAGTRTAHSFVLGTNNTTAISIGDTQLVGIGTTSPADKLHVIGDTRTDGGEFLALHSDTVNGENRVFAGFSSNGSNGKQIELIVDNTEADPKAIINTTKTGGSAVPLVFEITGSEAMRIDSSGRVGIGTSSPSAPLDLFGVENGVSLEINTSLVDSGSGVLGQYQDIELLAGHASDGRAIIRHHANRYNNSSSALSFHTTLHLTGLQEAMRIDSSGNVGIGKTSPSTKLDVNGTVTATAFSGGNLGKVLQVLQGQNNTQISTTTHNSNFDITSISITPTSTSSKILILGVVMGIQGNNNSNNTRFDAKIFRGTTALNSSGANFWTFNTDYWREGGFAIHWLDSPSTTSATTYYLKGAWLDPNGGTCYVNKDGNSGYSTITVMEIAG